MNTILDDFRLLESFPSTSPSSDSPSCCHLEDNKACLDEATCNEVLLWEEQSKTHQEWRSQFCIILVGLGLLIFVLKIGPPLLGPIIDHHQHVGSSGFWMAILAYLFILVVIGLGMLYTLFHYQPAYTEYAASKKGIWMAHKKQVRFYDFKQIASFTILLHDNNLSSIRVFQTEDTSKAMPWFELRAINNGSHRLRRLHAWHQAAIS